MEHQGDGLVGIRHRIDEGVGRKELVKKSKSKRSIGGQEESINFRIHRLCGDSKLSGMVKAQCRPHISSESNLNEGSKMIEGGK